MDNLRFKLFIIVLLCLQQFAIAQQQAKLVAKIPFESRNGTIILNVKLNDFPRPLKLLFDTGADGMAVGAGLADSIGLKITRTQKASVVGGAMDISVSSGNTVHMGNFDFENQSIAIFKEMHKEGTDGIIGNTLARHYIVKVDYDRKELLLYNFGDFEEKGGTAIPFTIPAGLFIIPGTLSITADQPHTGNFVFDTGAAYNLICFRPFVKQHKLLVSGFKSESQGSTVSMGMTTPTFAGKAETFSFSNVPPLKNMSVTLMAGRGPKRKLESWL